MRAEELPRYYNACDILEHNLPERAGKQALFSAERTLTFAEATREANQVSRALRRRGVRPGKSVGLLCLDCAEWVTAFFGIVKIGAIAIGIQTLLRAPGLAYILVDARPHVLFIHQALLPALVAAREELDFLGHIIVTGGVPALGTFAFVPLIAAEPVDLAPTPMTTSAPSTIPAAPPVSQKASCTLTRTTCLHRRTGASKFLVCVRATRALPRPSCSSPLGLAAT
jgi:acyl-CoA synthetase (AMP-forming)/AMP-acid ligase II